MSMVTFSVVLLGSRFGVLSILHHFGCSFKFCQRHIFMDSVYLWHLRYVYVSRSFANILRFFNAIRFFGLFDFFIYCRWFVQHLFGFLNLSFYFFDFFEISGSFGKVLRGIVFRCAEVFQISSDVKNWNFCIGISFPIISTNFPALPGAACCAFGSFWIFHKAILSASSVVANVISKNRMSKSFFIVEYLFSKFSKSAFP